ncbi:dihydrofolate reductase, partial [Pseudomonas gingeri]|nr:dihydrofolate reductase [Pseudomonas gingeri]
MSGVRIASQLDADFNARLRAQCLQVLELPRGLPADLPAEIQVLLAAPHAGIRDAPQAPP